MTKSKSFSLSFVKRHLSKEFPQRDNMSPVEANFKTVLRFIQSDISHINTHDRTGLCDLTKTVVKPVKGKILDPNINKRVKLSRYIILYVYSPPPPQPISRVCSLFLFSGQSTSLCHAPRCTKAHRPAINRMTGALG